MCSLHTPAFACSAAGCWCILRAWLAFTLHSPAREAFTAGDWQAYAEVWPQSQLRASTEQVNSTNVCKGHRHQLWMPPTVCMTGPGSESL